MQFITTHLRLYVIVILFLQKLFTCYIHDIVLWLPRRSGEPPRCSDRRILWYQKVSSGAAERHEEGWGGAGWAGGQAQWEPPQKHWTYPFYWNINGFFYIDNDVSLMPTGKFCVHVPVCGLLSLTYSPSVGWQIHIYSKVSHVISLKLRQMTTLSETVK